MTPIFLIGYRCTGKTSIGLLLADSLGALFVDTDQAIVAEQGRSISAIVAAEGWDRFRRLEKEMLASVCGRGNLVVATGGGIVLDAGNVAMMKRYGKVIWLTAQAETIYRRMVADTATRRNRPALTEKALRLEIDDTLIQREPRYHAAMDLEVETDGVAPEVLRDRILASIRLNFDIAPDPGKTKHK